MHGGFESLAAGGRLNRSIGNRICLSRGEASAQLFEIRAKTRKGPWLDCHDPAPLTQSPLVGLTSSTAARFSGRSRPADSYPSTCRTADQKSGTVLTAIDIAQTYGMAVKIDR